MAAGSNHKSKFEAKQADTRLWWHISYVCVIYGTVRACISTISRFMGGWAAGPQPTPLPLPPSLLLFPLTRRPRDIPHIKTKTVWHLLSLAPCGVFSITSHFTCIYFPCQFTLSYIFLSLFMIWFLNVSFDEVSVTFFFFKFQKIAVNCALNFITLQVISKCLSNLTEFLYNNYYKVKCYCDFQPTKTLIIIWKNHQTKASPV